MRPAPPIRILTLAPICTLSKSLSFYPKARNGTELVGPAKLVKGPAKNKAEASPITELYGQRGSEYPIFFVSFLFSFAPPLGKKT